ncbi:hypothetical protein X839_00890 [Streptococcus thermophilus MTH17CL396]|uniref:Uncharacterized protein n=2 Tax=Streptococcus thermophilus TaxID=1308 RepID=A0A2X3UD07_STRTR|nr:hypothetical protein X839_00890 [Streptococcus thermophilus MTH17CL396]ETW91695.1 hypothetical protein X841_01235 [Streptococcus thermophilus M17PTZA496]TDG56185.1 hypothetical protein C4K59_002323 [Streptococcus thermophilus]SQF24108.1 Uncharacterised protein [Streptococcus thermophilus]
MEEKQLVNLVGAGNTESQEKSDGRLWRVKSVI